MARSNRNPRSRSRSGRGGRRRRPQRRWGMFAIFSTAVLMLVSGGGYGLHRYMQIEKIDAKYCFQREGQAQTAIFLDYSVDLGPAQRRDLATALERAYQQTPVNGRIMIFTTARDSSGSLARPVFDICRPGQNADDWASINAPAETAARIQRIALEAKQRLNDRIHLILAETRDARTVAKESPILEQVQAISRYAGFKGPKRSFVWMSDGIQNSELRSFCLKSGHMPAARKFVRQPDFAVVKPDSFANVDVSVVLVESFTFPQPGARFCSNAELQAWWPEYFRLNGATQVRLERLRRVHGS